MLSSRIQSHTNIFISLGSNIGDRLFYINSAVKQIEKIDSVKIIAKSFVMETSPVGVAGQDKYLNQVFLIIIIQTENPILLLLSKSFCF